MPEEAKQNFKFPNTSCKVVSRVMAELNALYIHYWKEARFWGMQWKSWASGLCFPNLLPFVEHFPSGVCSWFPLAKALWSWGHSAIRVNTKVHFYTLVTNTFAIILPYYLSDVTHISAQMILQFLPFIIVRVLPVVLKFSWRHTTAAFTLYPHSFLI